MNLAAQDYILKVGDTEYIEITPIKDMLSEEWYSSDETTVEVLWGAGAKAAIKALKPTETGKTVTISCFYQYYKDISIGSQASYTERIYVKVIGEDPTSINLLPTSKTMHLSETLTLTPVLSPSNAYCTYTWSSSDASVATVSSEGVVTPVGFGETVITVTTSNNLSATCTITVEKADATSISIVPASATMIIGDKKVFSYKLTPTYSSNTVTWTSSDATVASINGKVVTARKAGTANIKAETDNGKYAVCRVTVPPYPNQMTLPQNAEVSLNKSICLTPQITPSNAMDYYVWSSSDETIATVDENGVVTGKKTGQVTITVRGKNVTTVSATCTVTVKEPEYKLIVWTNDGVKTSYRLNKRPTLTYNNGMIILSTSETTIEYESETVKKYTFEDLDEASNAILRPTKDATNTRLQKQDETILLEQCEPYSAVQIYAINGKLMNSYMTDSEGTLLFSISQYPQGVYIIRTKSVTHKIIKK